MDEIEIRQLALLQLQLAWWPPERALGRPRLYVSDDDGVIRVVRDAREVEPHRVWLALDDQRALVTPRYIALCEAALLETSVAPGYGTTGTVTLCRLTEKGWLASGGSPSRERALHLLGGDWMRSED